MISNLDYESIDEFEILYGEESAEEIIAREENAARNFLEWEDRPIPEHESALPELERELISYHKERKPHDLATIIVKIVRRA